MARFNYIARDSSGASLKGELTAASQAEAAKLLRSDGKYVVLLRQLAERVDQDAAEVIAFGGGRVRPEELIYFFSQLSIMVETGVSLADAIHASATQTSHGRFQSVLKKVLRSVESGSSFSGALAEHPKVFGDFYVNLLRAAEVSGTMGPMLHRCADYLTARRDIRKKVKSALTYPFVLAVAATGVTIFLMTFVLPRFLTIYAGKEATLPLPTIVLMSVTGWLVGNWIILLGGSIAAAVFVTWFFRAQATRSRAHWLQLRIPLIGGMLQKSYVTSSFRVLGILVDSGVSMLEAVAITRALSPNHYFEQLWSEVSGRLHQGDQLSSPLLDSPLIPRPIVQMVEAGEKSGQLGTVLIRLCDFLDEELRATIKTVTQMIEPLMITDMGVIVGGIAIALLLPIMTISKIAAGS